MRIPFLFLTIFLNVVFSFSQDSVSYKTPSDELLALLDIKRAPSVLINEKKTVMVFRYADTYKSIQELSETEMRLAGLRINPKTNIGSRTTYYNNVKIQLVGKKELLQVEGLPQNPRLANFNWSPDEKKIALTHTTENGVEVWVIDIESHQIKKLTQANVNANLGDVINWFKDSSRLLVKMLPEKRLPIIDTNTSIPQGPTISENNGKKAQNRTYQDLLKNPTDEHNFEQLAISHLAEVNINGTVKDFLPNAMYTNISFSPDGNYVSISTLEKPFSYIVPYRRFASKTTVFSKKATPIKVVLEQQLLEELPKGFMSTQKGPRNFGWRNDKPSSLYYVVALDEGDPSREVQFRDEVFEWEAPFDKGARSIIKTKNRFSRILWGNDKVAVAIDRWWNSRNTKTYVFNPSNPSGEGKIISDRNYQDIYSDPGDFITEKGALGTNVLSIKEESIFLSGDGYSEKGQFPFVDKMNLDTYESERIYSSSYTTKKETILDFDAHKSKMLIKLESKTEFPNFYSYNIANDSLQQLTNFSNPYQVLEEVHKEVITYKRDDGLDLSGTLYLPVGYTPETAKNLPMILWAYPREYKNKASASQTTQSPNEFTYLRWGSPVYWVTKGYVVLSNASFPIVGIENNEPNDSFRKQLIANATAAIDAVNKLGYIDIKRVAVGGHSYGAFMVANLLSHTNLFAAGIARSGAYNRTLTPFGFQSEERSYWDTPELYYTMSPFMHADKMKTPLLLVHGEADNNSGTYPMQSIRYFNALKGLGATVRLIMLPKESHGYRAKESIFHLIWEQDQWLERFLK